MEYNEALKVKVGDRVGFKYKTSTELFGEEDIDTNSIEKHLEYLKKRHLTVKDIKIETKNILFSFYEISDVINHRELSGKNPILIMGNKSYKI